MKTRPTDIDTEAATLFTPAPGMRIWKTTGAGTIGPRRVIEVEVSEAAGISVRTEGGWTWLPVCAIDTDDYATVGVMLAQFIENSNVKIQWVTIDNNGGSHCVRASNETVFGTGPTRGAALVAAMKTLKEPK